MNLRLPVPISEFAIRLLEWYRPNKRELPWRRARDPYRVWVSEIMLQQTQVKTVLPYFDRFLRAYPTLEALARAEESEILAQWSGLGYYNRARNLYRAAQIVCEKHRGRFPARYEDAIALPGVGRYTAGAVLSIAYGQPLPVLDGNVRRVLARYLKIEEELQPRDLDRLWGFLSRVVQHASVCDHIADFNQSLMELGARVCTPRKPLCPLCPLQDSCRARKRGVQEQLPRTRARGRAREVHYVVAVIRRAGKFLLAQNREATFLNDFWEFPKMEGIPGRRVEQLFRKARGLKLVVKRQATPVVHHVTFRKLCFHPVLASLTGPLPRGHYRWADLTKDRLPLPAYVSKIVRSVWA